MKLVAIVIMIWVLAGAALPSAAETGCAELAVPAGAAAMRGELTLADLLAPGTCERVRQMAEQVTLGAAPRPGNVRVLDGGMIRAQLKGLVGESLGVNEIASWRIPERITVWRAGATKSCAEFAQFVAGAVPAQAIAGASRPWDERVDCAAVPNVPEDTPLSLVKTTWNEPLRRWEFAVRCVRPEDCVPFLLWVHEETALPAPLANAHRAADQRPGVLAAAKAPKPGAGATGRLVSPGQTATLTWDQGGIRMVLPVTCLDAGGLGEFVRVRFKHAARILQAEVVGGGTLRASL